MASSFGEPVSLDVNNDRVLEWVYVNTKGPDEACFIRGACYSLVMRTPGGWKRVVSGIGHSVGLLKSERDAAPGGYRTVVAAGSNSASEWTATVYEWRNGQYEPKTRVTCGEAQDARAPAVCGDYQEIMLQ